MEDGEAGVAMVDMAMVWVRRTKKGSEEEEG